MTPTRDDGMTLVELTIVVAIVSILAALAAVGMARARMAANEASAIGSLRAVASAQQAYAVTCGSGSYAANYRTLGTAVGSYPPYISADLGASNTPTKSGYRFAMARGKDAGAGPRDCQKRATNTAYRATAVPTSLLNGSRSFAVNAEGTIWQRKGRTAPAEPFGSPSTPIQ